MQTAAPHLWRWPSRISLAWVILTGLAAIRVLYAGRFPLSTDEAYYWQWSRYLDLCYHDHPPMVAWLIALSTHFIGTHETAVRLPAICALWGTGAYLLLMARRWYSEGTVLATTLITQTVLLFNAGALITTPDSFQALAWAGACYHVARGYEANTFRHWGLGGLWFGMGMLSKLSMAIFPPLVFLYGLLSPIHRQRLTGWRPYLGLCLGIAAMVPLMAWNLENDWRAFRHVAHQGGVASTAWFVPRYFGDYLLSQLALLSPIVFLMFLKLLTQGRRLWQATGGPWMDRYLWLTAFPVFLIFALLSAHTRVEGNWPAFGYLGACVLLAARFQRRPVWNWALATAALVSLTVLIQVIFPLLPLPYKADRIAQEFGDWRPVGEAVEQLRTALTDEATGDMATPFIFGLNYQMASQLAFYTPGQPRTVALNRGKRPNTYDYWWSEEDLIGRDAVGVSRHPDMDQSRLTPFFETVLPPVPVTLYDHRRGWGGQRRPLRTLYLYRAHGFLGGHRWTPQDESDIRIGRTDPTADIAPYTP